MSSYRRKVPSQMAFRKKRREYKPEDWNIQDLIPFRFLASFFVSLCANLFLLKQYLKVGVHLPERLSVTTQTRLYHLETEHSYGLAAERVPILILLFNILSIGFLIFLVLFLNASIFCNICYFLFNSLSLNVQLS